MIPKEEHLKSFQAHGKVKFQSVKPIPVDVLLKIEHELNSEVATEIFKKYGVAIRVHLV